MATSTTHTQPNMFNRRLLRKHRLWIQHPLHGGWVKITLDPMKELVISGGRSTDEGYYSVVEGYCIDLNRRCIVCERAIRTRDCDGTWNSGGTFELRWDDIPNMHPDHGEDFWNPTGGKFATPPRGWVRRKKNSRGEIITEDEE